MTAHDITIVNHPDCRPEIAAWYRGETVRLLDRLHIKIDDASQMPPNVNELLEGILEREEQIRRRHADLRQRGAEGDLNPDDDEVIAQILSVPEHRSGTTYYCSNTQGSHSDANTAVQAQSKTTPWQTITHAATVMVAGDTLVLYGGDTFTENPAFTVGVTVTAITSGGSAWGASQPTVAGTTGSCFTFTNCDGVLINNLKLTMTSLSATAGVNFVNTNTSARYSNGVSVTNCTISGGEFGLLANAAASTVNSGYAGMTFTGNTITSCLFGAYIYETGGTNNHTHFSNVLIDSNIIHDLVGNAVSGSGVGVDLGTADVATAINVISNNLVHDCGNGATTAAGPQAIFTNFSDSVTIKGNVAYNMYASSQNTGGEGFGPAIGCTNVITEYNVSYNNQGSALLSNDTGSGTSGNIFRFNLSFNDGITIEGACNLNADKCHFHNNTILAFGATQALIIPTAVGQKVYNNVFSSPLGISCLKVGSAGAGLDVQKNAYMGGGGYGGSGVAAIPITIGATTYATLALAATASSNQIEGVHPGYQLPFQFAGTRPFPSSVLPGAFAGAAVFGPDPGSSLYQTGLDLNSLYSINPGTQDLLGNSIPVPYNLGAINQSHSLSAWAKEVILLNPFVWWRLGEASGTALWDSMGAVADGTYHSATLGTASLLANDPNTAATFSGANGSYALASWSSSFAFYPVAMTVACWIKPSSLPSFCTIMSDWGGDSGTDAAFIFGTASTTEITGVIGNNTSSQISVTSSGAGLVANTKAFVAMVWDGANGVKLYVNGVLKGSGTGTTPSPLPQLFQLAIGSRTDGHYTFPGVIDEALVFGSALTAGQLLALYNAGNNTPITLSPSSLPNGDVSLAYLQTVTASGGNSTITSYAVLSGTLPTSLTLNASTGVISGSPSVAAGFSFTIRATDSVSDTGDQAYSVTINAALTLSYTLASGALNVPYSGTVIGHGGSGTYTYAVFTGTIPTGLTLNTSTGAVTGTPSAGGGFTFTVTVADGVGTIQSGSITVNIAGGGNAPLFFIIRGF